MKTYRFMLFALSITMLGFSSCVGKNSNNIATTQNIIINVEKGGTIVNVGLEQNINNSSSETYCAKYNTAIIEYAKIGNNEGVECALQKGANIETKDKDGWTSLIWASYGGYTDTVELLLLRGANIDARNENGTTSLIVASHQDRLDTVKLLLQKGANININNTNKWGYDALKASYNKHSDEVKKILLENGAKEAKSKEEVINSDGTHTLIIYVYMQIL